MTRTGPTVLVSKTSRRRLYGGPCVLVSPMPALFTRISSRWWRLLTWPAAVSTEDSDVTSSWIASMLPLRSGRAEIVETALWPLSRERLPRST